MNKDINESDYEGRTALHIAASEGHLNIVKYLVNHGSDVDIKDSRGNTALDDAIRENKQDVVDFLN